MLIDIVRAVDGESSLDGCVLGFPACRDQTPCPVHDQWKRAKEVILTMLQKKTLAELGKGLDGKLEFIAQSMIAATEKEEHHRRTSSRS